MARYCSPQLSVRTRLSPPYRATIRLKVFQGRNSISWAKNVLPVFIKASRDHPGSLRQLQIVDTALCPETRIIPGVQSRRLSVNRTAVTAQQTQKLPPKSTTHFIYFSTGSHALTPEDQDRIRDVAGMIQSTPTFVATIIGKADSVGS